ncbi:MAG: methionyl-tRNA formyltransferase [Deltaproteobacteria bacterium]|nr:methionyl-tRNA formyltransferase [Deltaproteobacteria bacterium]
MRIVLFGQAAFGAKSLEALAAKGEEVVAAYVPPDGPAGAVDPLKEAAIARGVPVFQPPSYRDAAVLAQYRALAPDLAVLAFVTDIIPKAFFEAPRHGAICYHPSLLPRHRGASAINWAVIMGDRTTGLSIFWPDDGIDTGPLLLQKTIEIGPDDTTGSLYFNRLFPMGVDALVEAVALIREGKAPRTPQAAEGATYEPPCDDSVAAVKWDRPAADVYDLVRGCDPQPGAFGIWKGERVRFYGARLGDGGGGPPGAVAGVDAKGLRICLQGATLVVPKLRGASGGKMDAVAFAEARGLKSGDAFEPASR